MDEYVRMATLHEPRTYEEATSCPNSKEWAHAMDDEMRSILDNETWELMPLPQNKRAIGSKWCFKMKTDADGNPTRYKARFIAQGFSQRPGIDFTETYYPVAKMISIRTLLSIAATRNMKTVTMDVDTAYLYGKLDDDTIIYLKQAKGYEIDSPNGTPLFYRMKKALYGLKQSGRTWWIQIDSYLKSLGFINAASDPCIYTKGRSAIIGLYVDDIIAAADDIKIIEDLETNLKRRYKIKMTGHIRHVLGMKVERDRAAGKMKLSQTAHIDRILLRFGMSECSPAPTPITTSEIPNDETDQPVLRFPFREAVG